MRRLLLITCAVALSACTSSDIFAPFTAGAHHGAPSHGGQYHAQNYQQHTAQHGTTYAQPGYAYPGHTVHAGAPVSVNPQGYHQPHYAQGYGVPALRGASQPQVYGNLGLIKYDVDEDPYGGVARIGVQNGILGAELEATTGIGNQDEIDTDYSVAAFGVVRAPLTHELNLLGRVGYNKVNINDSIHIDDFAYGVGAEYNFDHKNGVRFDYTRYELEEFGNADSISATYLRRF